ncbi:MAG: hypothetical protein NTW17_02070 [Candidatus Pacearchaeota archaeon]|nr:hypothetical protein [Candidatus Pacearchaeota archaeon]
MKRFFRFRYPKLALICISIVVSFFLFGNAQVQSIISGLNSLTYLGIFIAGLLFSFGFSTPLAIGFFLTASPENIFLATFIGGVGAMLSDLLIFHFIKFSVMDEFNRLEKTKPMKMMIDEIDKDIKKKIRNYLAFFLAGIIIASPLPDELGVGMLAGLTAIKPKILALISFIMNSVGIFLMLWLGNAF